MRVIIFWVIALMILPLVSYAQVDTLELVEIGSIQASSEITELYVEDLDGDSLKEIILCTDYFVYIYDSQTYQVKWTSPPLLAPTDLLFEDINGDGLTDLSVKDSTNIHLFDPHTPQTIWTSPPLDSTYKCYTIGDRNDDDWVDVAVVKQESFSRPDDPNNRDTSWVLLFNGPQFSQNETFTILLSNFSTHESYYFYRHSELAAKIAFSKLGDLGSEENRIAVCSEILDYYDSYVMGESWSYSGNLFMFNGINFDSILVYNTFQIDKLNRIEVNSEYFLHLISYWQTFDSPSGHSELSYYIHVFNSNSLIALDSVWNGSTWRWRNYYFHKVGEAETDLRIFYGTNNSLHTLNYDGSFLLWENSGITQPFEIISVYNDNTLFSAPQITCGIGYQITHYELYDGADGSLSAIIPLFGGEISLTADLDNDGIDAVLSIQNSELKIYLDETVTDIEEDSPKLPSLYNLSNYPNPFNSFTTIEYGLPEAGNVNIAIYDLLGRKVETLVNEEMQAGRHQVVWEADRYASGLYFYRIDAGDYSDTKRMVYLK